MVGEARNSIRQNQGNDGGIIMTGGGQIIAAASRESNIKRNQTEGLQMP